VEERAIVDCLLKNHEIAFGPRYENLAPADFLLAMSPPQSTSQKRW